MEQVLVDAVKFLLSQHHDAFHPTIRAEAQAHMAAITSAESCTANASGTASAGSDDHQ